MEPGENEKEWRDPVQLESRDTVQLRSSAMDDYGPKVPNRQELKRNDDSQEFIDILAGITRIEKTNVGSPKEEQV